MAFWKFEQIAVYIEVHQRQMNVKLAFFQSWSHNRLSCFASQQQPRIESTSRVKNSIEQTEES